MQNMRLFQAFVRAGFWSCDEVMVAQLNICRIARALHNPIQIYISHMCVMHCLGAYRYEQRYGDEGALPA